MKNSNLHYNDLGISPICSTTLQGDGGRQTGLGRRQLSALPADESHFKIKARSFSKLVKICCIFFIFLSIVPVVSFSQGFRVSGNQLLDANGNNFVMKKFNVPTAWFVNDVNNNITSIRNRTGANCLRIVVTTSTSDAAWQTSVTNCIANKMIQWLNCTT